MRVKTHASTPVDLAAAERQFSRWRAGRGRGKQIPEHLWASAVRAAANHGLNRTTAALRLDYYSLKRHVELASLSPPAKLKPAGSSRSSPAFMELALPGPASSPSSQECTLEFKNADGSSLRIQLKGGPIPDVLALGDSFWSVR